MKKFTIIGLAVCLAFALAAPATAVDVDFSGHYYARGSYVSHWDLDEDSASNAYMDMQFRLQTVFKASDILSVTTRFDAMDERKWGGKGGTGGVDFDRAYMTIKAPIGSFYVGRMAAGAWGTSFIDTETSMDRIKYVKKIDNLALIAIFQKNKENAVAAPTEDDRDSDTYYLLGKYKMENTTSGLLLAFKNDKTTKSATKHVYVAIPYFVSKFGPVDIQGELGYKWGEKEFDSGAPDLDIKMLAYNLEATYNFGPDSVMDFGRPASVMAGYAFVSGDDDNTDDEKSGYGGVGDDWGKLFILTTSDVGVLTTLGGAGNLSKEGITNFVTATTIDPGAKIIYAGANYSPLDNLELGVVVGTADADEVPTGVDDDYGMEYDFTLNWKIYDNLTYSAIAAFLDAGDIWKGGAATAEVENTYALFHQLELAF